MGRSKMVHMVPVPVSWFLWKKHVQQDTGERNGHTFFSCKQRPYLDKAEFLYEYELLVSGSVVTSNSPLERTGKIWLRQTN